MKLNPMALACSSAAAVAIIWTICSLFVLAFPSMMSGMTGHMLHIDPHVFTWILTLTGYLFGLIAWCSWAAVTGWLIAVVYNKAAPT